MKIAIIDFRNEDNGLNILFPDADYYILEEEYDKSRLNSKYNIKPILHTNDTNVFELIDDEKYDTLFIICRLYDALEKYNGIVKKNFFYKTTYNYLLQTVELIKHNNFKNVCFFDNYDYDYDPNIVFDADVFKQPNLENKNRYKIDIQEKNIKFFKRYYNKEKTYKENVYPFPYITFGRQCNMEMITDLFYKNTNINTNEKKSRIFFSGTPLTHIDDEYGLIRNRKEMLLKIMTKLYVYNPLKIIPNDIFIEEMRNSKYSLDLLGVGDPNTRTFEILFTGSLKM